MIRENVTAINQPISNNMHVRVIDTIINQQNGTHESLNFQGILEGKNFNF